ncbi:hypothetical protein AAG906_025743 [Vitis piasezkii]
MDRGLLTDEALCEEASCMSICFIPLGGRDLFLLLLLLSDGREANGGEGPRGSLRVASDRMDVGGTTVAQQGLANSWASPRKLVGIEVGIFSISCRFKNREDGFMWFFTGVYGPTLKMALRDLPLQGGPYTWSGGMNGQSKSRLDCFLISEDWENHFSGVSQRTLPRPVSDHSPILLDGGGVRRGPIPFCFENMW